MPRLCEILVMLIVISGSVMAARKRQHISNCQDVTEYFPYCLVFLKGYNRGLSQECCDHVKVLNMIADRHRYLPIHKYERRRICQCIENMVKGTSPLISSRILALPMLCSMDLSFPISNNRDCSRV